MFSLLGVSLQNCQLGLDPNTVLCLILGRSNDSYNKTEYSETSIFLLLKNVGFKSINAPYVVNADRNRCVNCVLKLLISRLFLEWYVICSQLFCGGVSCSCWSVGCMLMMCVSCSPLLTVIYHRMSVLLKSHGLLYPLPSSVSPLTLPPFDRDGMIQNKEWEKWFQYWVLKLWYSLCFL